MTAQIDPTRQSKLKERDPSAAERLRSLGMNCAVFGVRGRPDAAQLAARGLHALQHRGQEACGIATYEPGEDTFHLEKRRGLVGEHLGKPEVLDKLPGEHAVGHSRYSTSGGGNIRNTQPLFADLATGGVALAHNGQITNARALRRQLVKHGAIFQSTSDTEVILQLAALAQTDTFLKRFIEALRAVEGSYALVGHVKDFMFGARDPAGIRPLVLGHLDGAPILASETCALELLGAKFVRDVENGEIVVCRGSIDTVESIKPFGDRPSRPCLFEYVYFAKPDSVVNGRPVYETRKRMGQRLAEEQPADADVVVPVPDSGVPAAIGYAQASGLPFEMGIIRNHYVARTFIDPSQDQRRMKVRKKHAPNACVLRGKRVVLVDDSIVRGNTCIEIVKMVKEAGAKEVHFRVASPPVIKPDYYGIDMPTEAELFAHGRTIEQMRAELDVTSLGYLSIDGIYWAVGDCARLAGAPAFSDHCFTGDYPTPTQDADEFEEMKQSKLSNLFDVA